MRTFSLAALVFFCSGAFGSVRMDLPPATPQGLRGLVPLEASELAVVRVQGGFWAVFTGLKERSYAIYARRFDESKREWSELIRLSQGESPRDSRPTLFADSRGGLHCAWLSRLAKKKYAILYSRLEEGADDWSEPLRFDGGARDSHPRLGGDQHGNLYLYCAVVTGSDKWGRIAFWASGDGGGTWEESDPNFPAGVKKGKASDPVLAVGEGGRVWLAWLDQTPGGRSVVLNASRDGGKTWLESPSAVNANKQFSLSNPRLLVDDADVLVFWTVTLLESAGRKTEFWADRSADGGRTWTGNRLFHRAPVSDVTLMAYKVGQDVGCVWQEHRQEGGALSAATVWRDGEPVEGAATTLLEEPTGSYIRDLFLVSEGDGVTVFYASQDAFDAGRVGLFHKPGPKAAWDGAALTDVKSTLRSAAPVAALDKETKVYTVGFHQVRRRPLIGAPEAWDSGLRFSQFKLEDLSGDEG